MTFLIPIGALVLGLFRDGRTRRRGVPATGRVTDATTQGMANAVPIQRLTLMLDDGQVTTARVVSRRVFAAGDRVALLVDPKDRARAVLA